MLEINFLKNSKIITRIHKQKHREKKFNLLIKNKALGKYHNP